MTHRTPFDPSSAGDDTEITNVRPQSRGASSSGVSRLPAEGTLVIVSGNDAGREIPLDGEKMTIGRAIANDIVLTDIAVSRFHAELSFAQKNYVLRDLRSGNGTFVNDLPQETPYPLRNGDRIEIGNTQITIIHPASIPARDISSASGSVTPIPAPQRESSERYAKSPVKPTPRRARSESPPSLRASPSRRGWVFGILLTLLVGSAIAGQFVWNRSASTEESSTPPPRPEPITTQTQSTVPPSQDAIPALVPDASPVDAREPAQTRDAGTLPNSDAGVVQQSDAGVAKAPNPSAPSAATRAKIRSIQRRSQIHYKRRRFRTAAKILRKGAKSLPKPHAHELGKQAQICEAVGEHILTGRKLQRKKPIPATKEFRKALALDSEYFGGTHHSYLRKLLAPVAPRAAAVYLARKEYAEAYRATTIATRYTRKSHPTIRRVRAKLLRRARILYRRALRAKRRSPKRARALAQQIQKLVPNTSKTFRQATRLLTKLNN